MKLHRFFIEGDLDRKNFIITDKAILNQWRSVFRFKVGDKLTVFDSHGHEAVSQIVSLGKDEAHIEIVKQVIGNKDALVHVNLYCSVLKSENFELVVQKTTEIGVKAIVPIITERTVKLGLRKERLEKIAKEASEQSGRGILPQIREPMSFMTALDEASMNDVNYFFTINGGPLVKSDKAAKIGVFIGPEGGWEEKEIALAKSAGFSPVTLGKLTLRAETAAIIASYLAVHVIE